MSTLRSDPAGVKACYRCGGTDHKLPLAAMCDRCADDWLRERRNGSAPRDEQPDAPPIHFRTAAEIRASTPERTDWLVERYVPARGVVLIAGRPKVGKSLLALALAEAITGHAPSFIGSTVKHGPVVYLAEENASTLRWKLPETDQLVILTRDAAWPKPAWPALTWIVGSLIRLSFLGWSISGRGSCS